jgi:hypothetical protein
VLPPPTRHIPVPPRFWGVLLRLCESCFGYVSPFDREGEGILRWSLELPVVLLMLLERDVVSCGPTVKFRLINLHLANLVSDHSRRPSHPASGNKKTRLAIIQVDGQTVANTSAARKMGLGLCSCGSTAKYSNQLPEHMKLQGF